ncbi:ribosome small subunit-dependent GTPase A [Candidatus Venteria ishoeyi]|uniref:Small ribosomal subunit biogenesis GTPase RsgA n=1 Tax=Candidatus Venteria ishoeyi TaxID=1899563 RepID=A0A1H6F6X1_9GAMM|nr:ribosome small subunit-dependent GTPase A [Candidatus Venteria ishoeyi]SEH04826.1 Putative ribosome biogenesis GTPase RsgA [Candidatus Venteria ishoeyi]
MQIHNLFDLGWTHYFQSQLDLASLESQLPFRVVSVQRNLIDCVGLDRDYQQKHLHLSTYYWRDKPPEEHPTIGDWILLKLDFQPLHILERKSLIKRRSAGRESSIQLIAANIDTLFIVTSCNAEFSINRIERYLSIAAESSIHCVVVLTKVDLCADTTPYLEAVSHSHPELPVELVNATDASTLSILKNWIKPGQTVALLGSSGVGKSTLINGLKGSQEQTTAAIRENDSKGRHTTTSRSLHDLPGGGLLLDTPGMRELQIVDSEEGIKATFADIDILAKKCRFKNCQHTTEPGCAIIEEIKAGRLEQRRLDNYHTLLSEQTRNNESLAERRSNDRALGRFYKNTLKTVRKFKSRE